MTKPSVGDKVSWKTQHGETEGKVSKKVTSDTKVSKMKVKADKENPKLIVKSEKTGKEAAHKPESLKKK